MGLFSKSKEEMPAPPMPPAPEENSSNLMPPSKDFGSLSAPPIPGGSLDDIKSQVARSSNYNANNAEPENEVTENLPDFSSNNMDDESLFDFSELDVDENNMKVEDSNEENSAKPQTSLEDLSFIKQSKKEKKFETFFITTKQFKILLEIVESVKKKVKEASETHLRLMDIKAEEDIEYENLRKDFEFIEDKLYEIDSIIFEK